MKYIRTSISLMSKLCIVIDTLTAVICQAIMESPFNIDFISTSGAMHPKPVLLKVTVMKRIEKFLYPEVTYQLCVEVEF